MDADIKKIIFADLNKVIIETDSTSIDPPADGIVIKTSYSCVSVGTELAKLTGLQEGVFPTGIGNRAIGRVVAAGEKSKFSEGDLVFSHTHHASHVVGAMLIAGLPDSLEKPETSLLGMAMVAFGGLRAAQPEIGDYAVVTGAGLVGQLLAQLLEIAGVTPILIDQLDNRLTIANTCGIEHTINASTEDVMAAVLAKTNGKGAEHVFECTGVPAVVEQAAGYCAQSGNLILVGSPRGEFKTDLTPFLNNVHIWKPHGNITIKGAHEWNIPIKPQESLKHNQQRNLRILADLTDRGKLKLGPLVTQVYEPDNCQEAYDSLIKDKANALGVVFDWTK